MVWFRGYKWIKEKIKINSNYVVFGKISWYLNTPKISHPEIILENDFDKQNQLSIHPIYSSTRANLLFLMYMIMIFSFIVYSFARIFNIIILMVLSM